MLLDIIQAIITAILPVLFFVIPGVFLIGKKNATEGFFSKTAEILLWSFAVAILLSLLVITIGLPVYIAGLIIIVFACLEAWQKRKIYFSSIQRFSRPLLIVILFLSVYTVFSGPFLLFHNGLPTGDSQKAIFWAEYIIENNSLPNYSLSMSLMNRDPVDFYTPGLHSYTALIMAFSPNPLISVAFMSIALAVVAAFIGAGIAQVVWPNNRKTVYLALLTIIFIMTNLRFLRYLREPGYHLQNLAGEVLLFGFLFLLICLIRKWQRSKAVLTVLTGIALFFTHQLSAFLAAFLLLPVIFAWVWHLRPVILQKIRENIIPAAVLASIMFAFIVFLISIGLHRKIPHIFTTQSHLIHLVPAPLDYLQLMGGPWLLFSLAGLAILWLSVFKARQNMPLTAFALAATVLLILSQAPRLGINIPPVRTLFYSVIPLSIAAAYFITILIGIINDKYPSYGRILNTIFLFAAALLITIPPVAQAYNLSHFIRTNATLTAGQAQLISFLKEESGTKAVLVDDYNRRSTSWLLLSHRPTFTRLAADLRRQMHEAHQSKLRYNLYLAHLDYEKIYSMGSMPEIYKLMEKHNIGYVTGITDSSDSSFIQNPSLIQLAAAENVFLYTLNPDYTDTDDSRYSPSLVSWLLRSSTLVNSIGDRQDTFAHLPASLRAAVLSDPKSDEDLSWRTTSAPYIPLKFNVGSYVEILFDQERTGYSDTALELFVDFATNTPEQLTVITPKGKYLTLLPGEPLRIKGQDAPWDDSGFITLTIYNPDREPIDIYLIALGLARTP